jgi:hypothetical protein
MSVPSPGTAVRVSNPTAIRTAALRRRGELVRRSGTQRPDPAGHPLEAQHGVAGAGERLLEPPTPIGGVDGRFGETGHGFVAHLVEDGVEEAGVVVRGGPRNAEAIGDPLHGDAPEPVGHRQGEADLTDSEIVAVLDRLVGVNSVGTAGRAIRTTPLTSNCGAVPRRPGGGGRAN